MIRKTVFYTLALVNISLIIWTYNTQVNVLNELRTLNDTKQVFSRVDLDLLDLETIGG